MTINVIDRSNPKSIKVRTFCDCGSVDTEPQLHLDGNGDHYECARCHGLVNDELRWANDSYWGYSGYDE